MPQDDRTEHYPQQDEEIESIREAYPLMDAVARQEGWDDPEMDSYKVYVEKPRP